MRRSKKREGKPKPMLNDYTANDIGKRGEKKTNKVLGATLTPGSGRGNMKGDLLHGYSKIGRTRERGYKRMIEKKSTKAKSIKLEEAWLTKIEKQALRLEDQCVIEFEAMGFGSKAMGDGSTGKLRSILNWKTKIV